MGRDMVTAARLITCVGCDSQAVSRGSVAGHLASTHNARYRAKDGEETSKQERERERERHCGDPFAARDTAKQLCNAVRSGPGLRQCRRAIAVARHRLT